MLQLINHMAMNLTTSLTTSLSTGLATSLTLEPVLGADLQQTMRLVTVLGAALMLGACASWSQRWLLSSRVHVLNWLLVTGLGAAAVAGLLLVACKDMPAYALLGEPLDSVTAWARLSLRVYAMSVSMLALLTMMLAMADRLIHRSSTDAMSATKLLAKMALPTSIAAMTLGFVLPSFVGMGATVPAASAVIGCMLWIALQTLLAVHGAGISAALMLRKSLPGSEAKDDGRQTRDDRRIMWLVIAAIMTPVLAMVGFMVLSLLLITMDTAGKGMMNLLGYSSFNEPSVAMMAVRWLWLEVLMVVAMATGSALMMLLGADANSAFGPSIRSMRQSQGRLSWFRKNAAGNAGFDAKAWQKTFDAHVSDDAVKQQVMQPGYPEQPTQHRADASAETAGTPAMLNVPPVPLDVTQSTHARKALPATSQVGSHVTPQFSSPQAQTLLPTSASPSWASLGGVFPTRGHYVILAFVAAVFVFYASLIPVEYRPLAWEEAVKRFEHVKYYKLGIGRRADVLANLVVIVPVTYLLMAAVTGLTWGWLRRTLAAIAVAATATAYIYAIEFTQEWFPPRTISLNDIQAGLSGAAAGIILWLAVGDYLTYLVKNAVSKRGSPAALRQVFWFIFAAQVIYGLFPMDFTLEMKLLVNKYEEGRIALLPFFQGNESVGMSLLVFLRDAIIFVPVGLLAWQPWSMRQPWSWKQSMFGIVVIAIVLELMRIPIYTSHTGTIHILGRIAGGYIGLAMVPFIFTAQGQLSLGTRWTDAQRQWWGSVAAVVMTLIAAIVLLYPFEFEVNEVRFHEKMHAFWNWPFKLYYYAGEWTALSKVVHCMALFLATGVLMRWAWNASRLRRWQGLVATLLLVGVIGFGVELGHAASGQRLIHTLSLDDGISMGMQEQAVDVTDLSVSKGMVFSIGKVADVTDWLAYMAGAMSGWVVAGLMLPVGRREEGPDSI